MKIQAGFFLTMAIGIVFGVPAHASSLQDVDSWVYQLQDADVEELAATEYDVVVMDYSKDGTDDEAYTSTQIKSLQDSGKIVLAYFSIGEAEDYRFYWQNEWSDDPPAWLGPENPEWEGNYKVKYWKTGWWNVGLDPYLTRIEDAGFDGVYLDIIDGYEYWADKGQGTKKSANRMVALIKNIRANLDTVDTPIVCPQNGEAIIDDAGKKNRKKYWKAIDCIGVEDLFYHSSKSDRKYRKKLFRRFSAKSKVILNVEYIKKKSNSAYLTTVGKQDFSVIPYRAKPNRDLDSF